MRKISSSRAVSGQGFCENIGNSLLNILRPVWLQTASRTIGLLFRRTPQLALEWNCPPSHQNVFDKTAREDLAPISKISLLPVVSVRQCQYTHPKICFRNPFQREFAFISNFYLQQRMIFWLFRIATNDCSFVIWIKLCFLLSTVPQQKNFRLNSTVSGVSFIET